MADQEIGKVIHYFDKAMVAVVRLSGGLKLGDAVKFVKGEEEHEMKAESLQIDHKPVDAGKAGDELAIRVENPVKEGAALFKVAE